MNLDEKVYMGGHGRMWSVRDMMEQPIYEAILKADRIELDYNSWFKEQSGHFSNGEARKKIMDDLIQHGYAGMSEVEERDGVLYVQISWCFVG